MHAAAITQYYKPCGVDQAPKWVSAMQAERWCNSDKITKLA